MLSDNARQALLTAEIDDTSVRLTCGQLDRDVYTEINTILTRLGGTWRGGRTQRHIFPESPAAHIRRYLETGLVPPKNALAFFPTPDPVIDLMLLMGDIPTSIVSDARILEPSAGSGALARRVRTAMQTWCDQRGEPHAFTIDTVELDPWHVQDLRDQGFTPHHGDFLGYAPDEGYDLVIMNPPFSVDGRKNAAIDHIQHAYTLLKPHGTLVAIAPASILFHRDAKTRSFVTFANRHGSWERVGEKAFRASGTDIDTLAMCLEKSDQSWRKQPYEGWMSWDTSMLDLLVTPDDTNRMDALIERIRSGELECDLFGEPAPSTINAVRQFYEPIIARSHAEGVSIEMTDAEWRYMADSFLELWHPSRAAA